ncbi:MAG: Fur family transcriptional regulator [Acidimicrobiia bacterium]
MKSDVHAAIADRLRQRSERYTEQRRALIEALRAAKRPATVPELLDRVPNLAQSSVYRNLAVLERADAVRRVAGADEWARYELAEGLTDHHHHLICESCGAVFDFTVSDAFERDLHHVLDQVADRHGFSAAQHRLDLVGRCRDCG